MFLSLLLKRLLIRLVGHRIIKMKFKLVNLLSLSVSVFVVKEEAFHSPCLPQDYKDDIEISELVEF